MIIVLEYKRKNKYFEIICLSLGTFSVKDIVTKVQYTLFWCFIYVGQSCRQLIMYREALLTPFYIRMGTGLK